MIRLEKCPICKADDWHDLDYLRNPRFWQDIERRMENEPIGFKICKSCGFVTYDLMETDRLNALYNFDRSVCNFTNIVTCNRKNEYHKVFLATFKEWERILKNPNSKFLDVGCSQGAFLELISQRHCLITGKHNKENLYGIEVNRALAAFGRRMFGLNIAIDEGQEYFGEKMFDFISYYHVLEHLQNPDVSLDKAIRALKDDGYIYISVPYWIDATQMSDGSICNDFEQIYHPNHVNVFTHQSAKNLMLSKGLEIVLDETGLYGYTMICKKGEVKPIIPENWQDIVTKLETEKKAIDLMNAGDFEGALAINPLFPDCYLLYAVSKDNMRDIAKQMPILQRGLDLMPREDRIILQMAKLLFQWDENNPRNQFYSNNIKKSEKLFKELLKIKPGLDELYYFLGIIEGKYKKDIVQCIHYFQQCIKINPGRWGECTNFIGLFIAQIDK